MTPLFLVSSFRSIVSRGFHASAAALGLQNHKLYPKVDWEKVDAGQYAVVDPVNPGVILYLSEQDYIIMVRVAITSNKTLKVLAVPGDSPEPPSDSPKGPDASSFNSSTSQNSPDPAPEANASWLRDILNWGRRNSRGSRGRKRARYLFSSPLLPFAKRVQGREIIRGLYDGVLMVKLDAGNIVKWFHTWHDRVSWWSRGSQTTTVPRVEANSFGLQMKRILVKNGIGHLIARMKIMLFVVNAFLGGRKLTTTADLGFRIRLRNGLPAMLPLRVRDGIRQGNRHYIHIWTSVLFAYKGIMGKWTEPNLEQGSITNPHPNIEETKEYSEFAAFASIFWSVLTRQFGIKQPDLSVKTPFFSTKAGPNSPITILGAGIDAYLWFASDTTRPGDAFLSDGNIPKNLINEITGVARNYIREWLELTGQKDLLLQFRKTAKMFALQYKLSMLIKKGNTVIVEPNPNASKGQSVLKRVFEFVPKWASQIMGHNNPLLRFKEPTLQRLHNLYEAAGKVRTIAIVDYWTNFVLKPLHDWMFSILTLLPQDATFDQEGRVVEFSQRGYTDVYSYDLKSATDLIPLALYKALFGNILPKRVLDLWVDLLVGREFLVPRSTLQEFPQHARRIRYSTGQPMGALTSWASMALVHHALVLYAAVRSGRVTFPTMFSFRDYLVLGDDIVIADPKVAAEYMHLMRILQIPVGLAKSHISEIGMFNFANQTFVANRNVSPVSMREDLNANSLPARAEFAMRMARRGWMDVGARTWLITILKKFFDASIWNSMIRPLLVHRRTHPVIQWIVAVLLTPGATRFGFAGMSNVNTETFLAAQLRKGSLWSTRVSDLYRFLDRIRGDPLLISILGKWVNQVYRQFLENRNRFLGFDRWVKTISSVDIEWLMRLVFEGARKDAFDRWTASHRIDLKTIQVSTSLTQLKTKELIEIATGMPWNDLVTRIAKAEAELPLVPEFSQESLEVIHTGATGGMAEAAAYRQQLSSFLRVTALLGMIDHLGPTGTPGFVEPGENPKSLDLVVETTDQQNKSPES